MGLSIRATRELGLVRHFNEAFLSEDERTSQKPFIIAGFEESPIIGSGFGAYAGNQRSNSRPWTFELTYHRLLFNVGTLGARIVGGLFAVYFLLVVGHIGRFSRGSANPFALLVAFCLLLIGAYSNPYFDSFDCLLFFGLLPYLSTIGTGFQEVYYLHRNLALEARNTSTETPAL